MNFWASQKYFCSLRYSSSVLYLQFQNGGADRDCDGYSWVRLPVTIAPKILAALQTA